MKHFVTLFPPAKNVHLVKDVGQIPYQMHKHFGYTSTLVCYKNEIDYPYLQSQVDGLNIKFLERKGSTFFWEKAVLQYLLDNARSINVLNLYHLTQDTMLYGMVYKQKNPGGILYLKMDMDVNKYSRQGIRFSTNAVKNFIHNQLFSRFKKNVDIVSVETDPAYSLLNKLDQVLFKKAIKLPTGLDFAKAAIKLDNNLFDKKENTILTVGRIGIKAKNNELLLNAIKSIDLKGWKVIFVGPVAESFKPVIEKFYKNNPDKKESVLFTGEIRDRQELWHYYARAKVFCLPSRWESFATVLCEAQRAGNYIIGTDSISSINEITAGGELGEIVKSDNVEELQSALSKCIEKEIYSVQLMERIINHSHKYEWKSILKKLDRKIDEVEKKMRNHK